MTDWIIAYAAVAALFMVGLSWADAKFRADASLGKLTLMSALWPISLPYGIGAAFA